MKGKTTQYLRYEASSVFGIIGTGHSITFINKSQHIGKYVAVSACEKVLLWDLKCGTQVLTLDGEVKGTVTVLSARPPLKDSLDNTHIAVGYSDGNVIVFELDSGSPLQFSGHTSGVSSVAWDHSGMQVASASYNGEIVVWDVVSERGVVRLKGHKGHVTRVHFMSSHPNILVSSSVDSYIKFWDLDTNHCFRTLGGHRSQVWDFVLLKNDSRLITGSSDAELRVWNLYFTDLYDKLNDIVQVKKEPVSNDDELVPSKTPKLEVDIKPPLFGDDASSLKNDASPLEITFIGSIMRSTGKKVAGLITDGRTLACYGKGEAIDLYRIRDEDEIKEKVSKRVSKALKRARKEGRDTIDEPSSAQLADEIKKLLCVSTSDKLCAVHLYTTKTDTVRAVCLHSSNTLTCLECDDQSLEEERKVKVVTTIHRPGHRTEIRAVSLSSLSDYVVTGSGESIKVWERHTGSITKTLSSDYVTALVLPPGDNHVLVGTKSGHLQLYSLGNQEKLEDIEAHDPSEKDGETGVWSLALRHDGKGFLSGGSDGLVKFWSFELIARNHDSSWKRLSFIQDRSVLKVRDQVTRICCSSTGKYFAVATLDMKEGIYYADSLKLFHELYGKSMPATCLDFSTDETFIVSGSADSCVRIYGTNFGDMRRLIKNAHQGGVTCLQFLPNTHMFFTAGHDGTVKQWDSDNFERIVTLQAHHGIVRCMSVCPRGSHVVTCGQDMTIRLFHQTKEILVLEEEREEERRRKEEEDASLGAFQRPTLMEEGADACAVRPTLTTHETEKAVDMLIEGLTIFRQHTTNAEDKKSNDLMTHVYKTSDPLKFMLLLLRKIKSSELEEVIIVLPLNLVLDLLIVIYGLLKRKWDVEMSIRILIVAVRINFAQIMASKEAHGIIKAIYRIVPQRAEELQDLVGFNLAALTYLKDQHEQSSAVQLFAEAALKVKESQKKKRKKQRAIKRALLTL